MDASQNVEGQIIARNVVIGGEFHRNSVNVPITRHVEVRLDGQDKTETTPFVAPQPAREHYRFIVWTTNPDGTGDSYKPGDTVSDVAKGTTLYPQWEARHVLRYDVNGGDGEYGDSDLPADVTDTVPSRDGYEFSGWTIDGDNVESGDSVEDNGSDVTAVAQWTPVKQDVTPTKPDTPKNDTDKPSGTDTPSKDDGKDGNGSNDSGKTDTDKPSGTDTNVPSKDDSSKTDTDKPSDANTPKGQSDATSKAESPKDGLASTGVAVAAVAVAVVALAAGAIALAILGKRK